MVAIDDTLLVHGEERGTLASLEWRRWWTHSEISCCRKISKPIHLKLILTFLAFTHYNILNLLHLQIVPSNILTTWNNIKKLKIFCFHLKGIWSCCLTINWSLHTLCIEYVEKHWSFWNSYFITIVYLHPTWQSTPSSYRVLHLTDTLLRFVTKLSSCKLSHHMVTDSCYVSAVAANERGKINSLSVQ